MKTLFLKLLLVCFCINTGNLFAQASLGFDQLNPPGFPSSIPQNSTVQVAMSLKNFGNVSFFGDVKLIEMVIDSSGNPHFDSISNIITQANIPLGAVLPYTYFAQYPNSSYTLGIDVVVIWPRAANTLTHDSITYQINITGIHNLANTLTENGISVYPNPFTSSFTIKNKYPANPIEKINVYTLSGELLFSKTRDESIDFTAFEDAVYVVELFYKSGMRKVMKVQKQSEPETK